MLLRANALALPLATASVQTVVTSPPYWGLRDYGVAGQIGLEPTPEEYVARIVEVFREVWRVLRDDGVLWVNVGDTYATRGGGREYGSFDGAVGRGPGVRRFRPGNPEKNGGASNRDGVCVPGLKPKDLVGIPWRVAFALQADGWYLRADIVWSKPNPMPESVRDRPTKAHEYVFLLSKRPKYYYDADAIAEPAVVGNHHRTVFDNATKAVPPGAPPHTGLRTTNNEMRNRRSVWTVASEPYAGSHSATFPRRLVEPCILAGSRVGDLVLDPFVGSGTVGEVASSLCRRWVGCDLSAAYLRLAQERTKQRGIFDAVRAA